MSARACASVRSMSSPLQLEGGRLLAHMIGKAPQRGQLAFSACGGLLGLAEVLHGPLDRGRAASRGVQPVLEFLVLGEQRLM